MIYALIGAIMLSLGNAVSRYITINFNLSKSLFFQYLFISFLGGLLVFFFGYFKFDFSLSNILIFSLIGLSGYLAIWSLFKAIKHVNTGIVLVVANTYVFLSYFTNIYLLGDIEKLSLIKIMLGMIYFFTISVFIFEKGDDKKIRINKRLSFALLTSIGWSIYFSLNNYLIKSNSFSPLQMIFYAEFSIFIFASIFFIFSLGRRFNHKEFHISIRQAISYMIVSFCLFLGGLFLFLGYKFSPGNYVNFISLSTVIFSPLFLYVFFKEKLNPAQMVTIGFALMILILFVY
ncbi:MAG: EamA family transporter [Candidatus Gracilibacteria bacterium]|nr:EamA family transporter [Candidatus Gracilibacteria bacterium]